MAVAMETRREGDFAEQREWDVILHGAVRKDSLIRAPLSKDEPCEVLCCCCSIKR